MSPINRKPSFLNPFARGVRKIEGVADRVFEDAVSPLDPGPSKRFASLEGAQPSNHQVRLPWEPTSSSPSNHEVVKVSPENPRLRTNKSIGVQAESASEVPLGDAVGSRKGSLSKLKNAGKVLLPPHLLRRIFQLVKNGRASAESGEEDGAATQLLQGLPPARPERPESLDLDFLELLGQYVYADGSPADARSPIADEVSPEVQTGKRNGIVFPKFDNAVAVPRWPPPRQEEPRHPPRSHRTKAPPSPSGSSSAVCWSVIQRNNIRIPPLRVAQWVTGGILGTGGFARVYLVYNVASKSEGAMKVVHYARGTSKSTCRGLINEITVLYVLWSEKNPAPFVLRPSVDCEMWTWLSSPGYLHILTDVCTGGDLNLYRRTLSVDRLALVCAEIILGLNHLHNCGIVHHDLKPHNVLVDAKGHCKISDYGGARFLSPPGRLTRDSDTVVIMTKAFAAPELLANVEEGETMEYDETIDYWSLGATIVSMIMEDNYLPGSKDIDFMMYRVGKIGSKMAEDGLVSDLQTLVLGLLEIDPVKRLKFPNIKEQGFFRELDWDDVLEQKCPAIPAMQEALTTAHGWAFETPRVHNLTNDPSVDFLQELKKECPVALVVNDSFNVEQQHAAMVADI